MKQLNQLTIVGIDQGYDNMKTANILFPTAITAFDTAPVFQGDVLEYDGCFTAWAKGIRNLWQISLPMKIFIS